MSQNVWEWLGLPADHRKEGKVVQLVKHMDEVPEKKITYPLIGQVKKDGVYCMAVKRMDGEVALFGRTGRMLTNTSSLSLDAGEGLPAGVVLIGELCCHGISLEELSGCVNPNRVEPLDNGMAMTLHWGLTLHAHDCLYLESFVAGASPHAYGVRRFWAKQVVTDAKSDYLKLIPQTHLNSIHEVEDFAAKHIEAGEEGVVLKQDLPWIAGHKGHHAMKRVRRVTYDLLCVGSEEGKGKRQGMVANLLFRWKGGKTIKADMGKNWSDIDRTAYWNRHLAGAPNEARGSIFTVYGLMDSSKGVIRLPKVGELRHDKVEADF